PDNTLNTADDPGTTMYAWTIPSTFPTKGQNDNVISNLRDGEGRSQYTAYEVTFNKQHTKGWGALASYNIDMGHVNSVAAKDPNKLCYKFDTSNCPATTCGKPLWSQAIKLSGQYDLPMGFRWAGTFSAQTGAWYSRTAQMQNADRTTVT